MFSIWLMAMLLWTPRARHYHVGSLSLLGEGLSWLSLPGTPVNLRGPWVGHSHQHSTGQHRSPLLPGEPRPDFSPFCLLDKQQDHSLELRLQLLHNVPRHPGDLTQDPSCDVGYKQPWCLGTEPGSWSLGPIAPALGLRAQREDTGTGVGIFLLFFYLSRNGEWRGSSDTVISESDPEDARA